MAVMFTMIVVAMPMIRADNNWTIDGDSVYVNDSNVFINITPHTITQSGEAELQLLSKIYSGDIDILFGFNSTHARPRYAKVLIGEEWVDVTDHFYFLSYSFQGFDRWYYATDIPINQGVLYRMRYWLDVNINTTGKYWFGVKPSGETLHEAIQNGHFYYIDPWFNSTFLYRQPFVINSSVSGSLANYTRNITVDTEKLVSEGKLQSDCDDIRFVDDDNVTILDFHQENATDPNYGCNTTSNVWWVQIRSVPGSTDTTFWMYYGNALVPSGVEDEAATYDGNFKGVWKFGQDFGAFANDSTINGRDGNVSGATFTSSGYYASAMSFDGDDDFINISDNDDWTQNEFTIESWLNVPSGDPFPTGEAFVVSHFTGSDDNRGWILGVLTSNYTARFRVCETGTCSPSDLVQGTTVLNDSVWHYVVGERNSTHTSIWIDGVLEGIIANGVVSVPNVNSALCIGYQCEADTNEFNGTIDEVRFSNISRGASYIRANFDQAPITVGAEEVFASLILTITSPTNSTHGTGNIDYNVSVTVINVSTVLVSINEGANISMDNDTSSDFFNLSGTHATLSSGFYNATFYANTTTGLVNSSIVYFTVVTIPPNITLPFYTNNTQVSSSDSITLNISVTHTSTSISICNVNIAGQSTNTSIAFANDWCNGSVPMAGARGTSQIFAFANTTEGITGVNDSFFVEVFAPVNITIFDEMTAGLYNMSLPNTTSIEILCSESSNRTIITDNTLIDWRINCTLQQIKVVMDFGSPIGTIFRTLQPDILTEGNISFYMPDPTKFTVLVNELVIIDLSGLFNEGELRLRKVINDTTRSMIEQDFTLQGAITAYIIKDETYLVTIIDATGLRTRTLNTLVSIQSGRIEITISGVSLNSSNQILTADVFWDCTLDQVNNRITFSYQDDTGDTINVTTEVFNGSNPTQLLFTDTTTGVNIFTTTFSGITPNQSYICEITGFITDFPTTPLTGSKILSYFQDLVSGIGMSATTMALIGLAAITMVALLFSPAYASIGGVVIAALIAFLTFIVGFFDPNIITWSVMALIFFLSVGSKLVRTREGKV